MSRSRHPIIDSDRTPTNAKRCVIAESIRFGAFGALRKTLLVATKLEYRLHASVISTSGAKVMRGLSVPGRFFYNQYEGAGVGLYKFVAGKVSIAFFKLAQPFFEITYASQRRGLALGGLYSLLLHGEYLSREMRELNVQFIGGRPDLLFIARLYRSLHYAGRSRDASQKCNNVHGGLPIGESVGVGTADSTDLEAPAPTPERDKRVPIGPLDI